MGAADMADNGTAAGALGAASAGRDTLLPQAASPVLAAERHGLALRRLVMGCLVMGCAC